MGEAVPPALRAKGPQLRVAEDEQKQTGKQKTSRPGKAKEGPAAGERALRQDEKAGQDDEESRQMIVEFTFFFVVQELVLERGVHLLLILPGPGPDLLAGAVPLRRDVLRPR